MSVETCIEEYLVLFDLLHHFPELQKGHVASEVSFHLKYLNNPLNLSTVFSPIYEFQLLQISLSPTLEIYQY